MTTYTTDRRWPCASCGATVERGVEVQGELIGPARLPIIRHCPACAKHPCPFLDNCPPSGTCAEHYARELDAHLARHDAERKERLGTYLAELQAAPLPTGETRAEARLRVTVRREVRRAQAHLDL